MGAHFLIGKGRAAVLKNLLVILFWHCFCGSLVGAVYYLLLCLFACHVESFLLPFIVLFLVGCLLP